MATLDETIDCIALEFETDPFELLAPFTIISSTSEHLFRVEEISETEIRITSPVPMPDQPDIDSGAIAETLLKANSLGEGTGFARFGLDAVWECVVLVTDIEYVDLDQDDIAGRLRDFLRIRSAWSQPEAVDAFDRSSGGLAGAAEGASMIRI